MYKFKPSVARWEDVETVETHNLRILEANIIKRRHPHLGESEFLNISAKRWVNVVPLVVGEVNCITPRKILIIEQFRHGPGEPVLEWPAGVVEDGEEPLAAALREVAEETGYEPVSAKVLGWTRPNAAFFNNKLYTVVMFVKPGGKQDLDEHEDIKVHTVTMDDIDRLIDAGDFNTGSNLSALKLYERWGGTHYGMDWYAEDAD